MKKCRQTYKRYFGIGIPINERLLSVFTFLILLLAPCQPIFTHGTVTSPPSRVWICFQEDPQSPDSPACEAAIIGWGTQALYDWNEVARMDAGGMHTTIIQDGNLASAGRPDKYGGLDQVRDDWIATSVTPGPYTVTWTNSTPHQTLYYDVYITKADWTPDQPLTWDSLELLKRTGPRPAAATDNIDVILPPRTGRHVIYSIWQRSLTPEAFYATSDVDFGSDPVPNRPPEAKFSFENGICGGPDVVFDASDSLDPDGDDLTYTWDFGDGTTAEGITASHSFSNLDSATVTLTVSDAEFSSGVVQTIDLTIDPDCLEPVCPLDTPRASPLPSINASFDNVYVVGANGPNLDNVTNCSINWALGNNGLYQFSLSTNNGSPDWYNNLLSVSTQSFNQPQPQITISNSGFEGLDGSYYATIDGPNFALVALEGGFTIYFSNSTTAPDCGDVTNPINTAPVANLVATPTTGITPLEVLFDASGSTDADNDTLTYSIDYGDGTSGTGITSTHIYSTGNYVATLAVSDGKGGTDSTSVNITVNDDVIDPPNEDCTFGVPIATPLSTVNTSYEYVHVLGTGGPNMDVVTRFTINWDLANNGLYQFSFDLNVAPWYTNFSTATQNFNSSSPQISLSGTGISGLDGDYYVTIDDGNFVLVADNYTLYFSNSKDAPNCNTKVSDTINTDEVLAIKVYPNPAVNTLSLEQQYDLINNSVIISDINGRTIKSFIVKENTKRLPIDISDLESGLYLIRVLNPLGTDRTLKFLVQ
ncbi:lytic polysaccharide monooxygenase [Aquimarina litoralis]|uniref:lytic polysaccharide monooxygenase n=1 Tax=Aquimarina litoralis TaxID=584605 RepID=UPI001C5A1D0E|nr:lytic polysaccharide monooxygenase [Aquimarina litoralis]MBW1298987.1 PKD domain-containing protein [Aquimarina litoralis]